MCGSKGVRHASLSSVEPQSGVTERPRGQMRRLSSSDRCQRDKCVKMLEQILHSEEGNDLIYANFKSCQIAESFLFLPLK